MTHVLFKNLIIDFIFSTVFNPRRVEQSTQSPCTHLPPIPIPLVTARGCLVTTDRTWGSSYGSGFVDFSTVVVLPDNSWSWGCPVHPRPRPLRARSTFPRRVTQSARCPWGEMAPGGEPAVPGTSSQLRAWELRAWELRPSPPWEPNPAPSFYSTFCNTASIILKEIYE